MLAKSLIELDRAHQVRGEPGGQPHLCVYHSGWGFRRAALSAMTMPPPGRPDGRLGV